MAEALHGFFLMFHIEKLEVPFAYDMLLNNSLNTDFFLHQMCHAEHCWEMILLNVTNDNTELVIKSYD